LIRLSENVNQSPNHAQQRFYLGFWGFGVSYLFNDELEHNLCFWAQVIHLHEFGFVQAVVRGEDLEEAVRAFVQSHGPVWVGFGEGEGGVVCCLEVTQALGTGVRGTVGGIHEVGTVDGEYC
jgi:hypothetical protein